MSDTSILTTLELLERDPEHVDAWADLRKLVPNGSQVHDKAALDVSRLLAESRKQHASRREYEAVAGLLDLELRVEQGSAREESLLTELARVAEEELYDEERAQEARKRLADLAPSNE